jgi:lipoprotein-anchoring transpeptidase ErfK/SrfK
VLQESCVPFQTLRISIAAGAAALAVAAIAAPAPSGSNSHWVAPGTKGSPIDGTAFHAQVLLDAAGFSPGVIDGKKGSSLDQAVKGFQEARGLKTTGKLDGPTRQALLQDHRPSTRMIRLTGQEVSGPFVFPFPTKPEQQAKLKCMCYRNMLEKVAERYHTTPATIIALNGRDKKIGAGQVLRLPNVLPTSRDYGSADGKQAQLMNMLNVDARQPEGSMIIVDKSDGVLKVYNDAKKLVAQFRVTTGSSHDPLPLGDWKVTTYSFLPPFNYQPDLFWDVADSKAEQKLPPGPNGPVGVAWLDLTKEHYGIHGTSEPQTIGHTESHGCLRLTNWDVMRLSRMMKPGFSAKFVA